MNDELSSTVVSFHSAAIHALRYAAWKIWPAG